MPLDAGIDRGEKRFGEKRFATYLQNKMTNHSVSKILVELFTGEKSDISHIKIFRIKGVFIYLQTATEEMR